MTRERLPMRRAAERFDFNHAGKHYHATVGLYPDNRIGEVFLTGAKSGADLQIVAIEAAVALSFALQHGADLDAIQKAMPRTEDGKPEGLIGSLVDALRAAI